MVYIYRYITDTRVLTMLCPSVSVSCRLHCLCLCVEVSETREGQGIAEITVSVGNSDPFTHSCERNVKVLRGKNANFPYNSM